MTFTIRLDAQPARFLRAADPVLQRRVRTKIEQLQDDPVPHDAKRVQGFTEKVFRVRIGDYRMLYEVRFATQELLIATIEKRSRAYE
jgi:mRNA interferase RelE/StbE